MEILNAESLSKSFRLKTGFANQQEFYAVRNISLRLEKGVCLGLVGESGCGKSTLAKMLVGLLPKTDGKILFKGQEAEKCFYNPYAVQMVFQDPFSSLNPRLSVGRSIGEPLLANKDFSAADIKKAAEDVLAEVGLEKEHYSRYPHEFSGGQRQRIAIARAIITKPELLVCDEPVSALDASHQAQILNLLLDLKEKYGLTYLFISHNLQVVSFMCEEIAVMYAGEIVEQASKEELFRNPCHPYTQALIASAPYIGKEKRDFFLGGEAPTLKQREKGCAFACRCPRAEKECFERKPELKQYGNHKTACHKNEEKAYVF